LFIEPKVTRILEYSSSSFKPIFLRVELGFPDELEHALPLLIAILFYGAHLGAQLSGRI